MSNLTSWQPKQNSWFLGIGINTYTEFPKLSNAVKDVTEVKEILIDKYDVEEQYSMTLYDDEATKENIIDTLDELGKKVKAEDKLFIYYSGHGHLNDHLGLGYWIPVDAQKDKAARYIPNSTVRDYVKGIKAKHILLVSDSCFSGSLFMQGQHRSSRAIKELDNLTSRWAICSGRHDEEVYDGDPGENSPFTKSFIDILKSNEQPSLNVGRVADRVIEETAANYEQLPDGRPLFGVGHQGGQYIFKQKGQPRSVRVPAATYPQAVAAAAPIPAMISEEAPQTEGITISKPMLMGIGVVLICALAALTMFNLSQNQNITPPEESALSALAITEVEETATAIEDEVLADEEKIDDEKNTEESTEVSAKNIKSKSKPAPKPKKTVKADPVEKKDPIAKAVPAVAFITNIDDAVVELFELENYKGRSLKLYGNQFSSIDNLSKIDVESMDFNDVISSAKIFIPADYEFSMYEKKKHKGEMVKFTGNGKMLEFPNLGGLDDKVTSTLLRKLNK